MRDLLSTGPIPPQFSETVGKGTPPPDAPPPVLDGWESDWYPMFDQIDCYKLWLRGTICRVESGLEHPIELREKMVEYLRNNTNGECSFDREICEVRDAHRVVRHLEKKCNWKDAPRNPDRQYFSKWPWLDEVREAVSELERVLRWIDKECKSKATSRDMKPRNRKAYLAFCAAEAGVGKKLTDKEAHEWIRENELPGDLQDYDPPAFETWTRYLSAARTILDENKHTSRTTRDHNLPGLDDL